MIRLAFLSLGVAAAALGLMPRTQPTAVVVGGAMNGYLTPCGCTKPMEGGLLRRMTAARAVIGDRKSLVLEQGSLSEGAGRQSDLKLETAALTLSQVKAVIGWFSADAARGKGAAMSADRLSGNRVVCGALSGVEELLPKHWADDQFLVGTASTASSLMSGPLGGSALTPKQSAAELAAAAKEQGLAAILMFEGDRKAAAELAEQVPGLSLIVYQHHAEPPTELERVGSTTLVTPGDHGKQLVRLEYSGGQFSGYGVIRLGEEVKPDPEAARQYSEYMSRVISEKLALAVPKAETAGYAGPERCQNCHESAYKAWKKSLHSHALETLAKINHDQDPDCLPCHTVGFNSKQGFISEDATPQFGAVSCENCHGPSLAHASNPKTKPGAEASDQTCLNCHRTDTSPGFSFETFWPKIKHK